LKVVVSWKVITYEVKEDGLFLAFVEIDGGQVFDLTVQQLVVGGICPCPDRIICPSSSQP
jgi:hypothetical protein